MAVNQTVVVSVVSALLVLIYFVVFGFCFTYAPAISLLMFGISITMVSLFVAATYLLSLYSVRITVTPVGGPLIESFTPPPEDEVSPDTSPTPTPPLTPTP